MKNSLDKEEVQKAKEIGFKIKNIEDRGSDFQVEVLYPDESGTREFFSFSKGKGWEDDVEYVKDGEKVEKPKWKKHIERKMNERLERLEERGNDLQSQLEEYEGEVLDLE